MTAGERETRGAQGAVQHGQKAAAAAIWILWFKETCNDGDDGDMT